MWLRPACTPCQDTGTGRSSAGCQSRGRCTEGQKALICSYEVETAFSCLGYTKKLLPLPLAGSSHLLVNRSTWECLGAGAGAICKGKTLQAVPESPCRPSQTTLGVCTCTYKHSWRVGMERVGVWGRQGWGQTGELLRAAWAPGG